MRLTWLAAALTACVAVAPTPANSIDEVVPPASTAPVLAERSAVPVSGYQVQRVLAATLSDSRLGRRVSAIVVDAATGQVVADIAADRPLEPASTVKLVTAIGALRALGPQTRFTTSLIRDGDRLVLVGQGDPTLTRTSAVKWRGTPPGVQQPSSIEQLAATAAGALPAGPWLVDVDASYFAGESTAPSWPASYIAGGYVQPVRGVGVRPSRAKQSVTNPPGSAQRAMVAALRNQNVAATLGTSTTLGPAATTLAEVTSPPVSSLIEGMLTTSDNTVAEYLARQVLPDADTFQAAAAAVSQAAQSAGVDMTAAVLRDGSGLSPKDRVTARTLVSALQVAARGQDSSWLVLSGLPIAGVSGTLTSRYPSDGRGYLRAKTGTLRGVVSLAGTVATVDGNVLLFAFIANGVPSVPAAQRAMDAAAVALARCGCS